jgi:hypothetical protein
MLAVACQQNPANKPPTANAGAEQTVAAGATVTLDASGSTDPENDVLSFAWAQTGGPDITLKNSSSVKATFTAPQVNTATTLVFQLYVTDGNNSSTASTSVTVMPGSSGNRPPVAMALAPQQVQSGQSVTLDATASSDPDGDSLTFSWMQTMGPSVALSGTPQRTTFTAPTVSAMTLLTFQLTVSDGMLTAKTTVNVTVVPATSGNHPPVANAGPDLTVTSGMTNVMLDGSGSTDPDGDPITYRWMQRSGPAVTLSSTTDPKPTFTAPTVTAATTLTFSLDVTDSKGLSATPDMVNVTVMPGSSGNRPPVAVAVAPPQVQSGQVVTLDASSSSDPDGDPLTYSWNQTLGPVVTLGGTAKQATFTAPTVTAMTQLTFKLTVSDGMLSATTTVNVTVVPATSGNHPPVANAGPDRSVTSGTTNVMLDGSGSSDPDGDPITYAWTQLSGPAVTLSSATGQKPTFTAPTVSATTTLTFSLAVTDSKGLSGTPDTVNVTVNPMTLPTANFTKVVSLHAVTRTGIVVFFMTDVAVTATVQYGTSSLSSMASEASPTTRHVVTLSGLTANTAYQYMVSAGTATANGTFTTAIDYAASPQPFSFAVAGDARGHAEWGTVATAIKAKNPRFMIQTGDNNDANGSAANWEDYYNVAPAFFANVPVFAAQGNHDTGSNFSVYNVAPQSSSSSDTYYAFVYGNASFVAINTNLSSTTMTTWVSSALSKLKGGPLFAFHHHPLFSCGSHGSDTGLQGTYKTTFETNTVTTDFTGHDHDLIYWAPTNGVRYVVSGGGGTALYPLSGCQGPYSRSGYGFMMVDVNGATITQTFYDDNGTQLYTTGAFQAAGASVNFANLAGLVTY